MEIFLVAIVALIVWFACGAYFYGKSLAFSSHYRDYSHAWGGVESVLFWPMIAVNVFAHEVKQDSVASLQAKRDEQNRLLEEAEKARKQREQIEAELNL